MHGLILLGLLAAAVAVAQQGVRVQGREISRDGSVTKARGDATISNSSVRIQADSINYNQATGEAEASGNVRIKFLSKTRETSELEPAPRPSPVFLMEERIRMMRKLSRPEIMAPEKR